MSKIGEELAWIDAARAARDSGVALTPLEESLVESTEKAHASALQAAIQAEKIFSAIREILPNCPLVTNVKIHVQSKDFTFETHLPYYTAEELKGANERFETLKADLVEIIARKICRALERELPALRQPPLDRLEIGRALARAVNHWELGEDAEAKQWAQTLVSLFARSTPEIKS